MDQEQALREEYQQLEAKLSEAGVYATPEGRQLAKRHAELQSLLALFDEKHSVLKQIDETEALADDSELSELARQELPSLQEQLADISTRLENALLTRDPNDAKNAIVEIRAGAGGDEAS